MAGAEAHAPFVGRSAELAAFASLIDEVQGGSGRVALVEGEPGIGKTRLVTESLARSRNQLATQAARADELERSRPFGILIEALGLHPTALDPARAAIGRIITGATNADPGPPIDGASGEFMVIDAIVTLLEELASDRPMALVLDDLQWIDLASLRTVHRVSSLIPELPILLVCSWRPQQLPSDVAQLLERMGALPGKRFALSGLAADEVAALAEQLTGTIADDRVRALLAGAAGNPLYLIELIAALAQEGTGEHAGSERGTSGFVLPPSLRLTILRRISFLKEGTLQLLQLASVLGSTFAIGDLSLASTRPASALLAPVQEAVQAGLLDQADRRLVFRHDLIREALYEDIPLAVRVTLHRQIADSLAQAGAPADRVAAHVLRSAEPGEALAVERLQRAAIAAGMAAPQVAIELLERAIQLTVSGDPIRNLLRAQQAAALLWVGHGLDAERICREVLAGPHDEALDELLRPTLVFALLARGRVREALNEASAGIDSPQMSDAGRVRLQAWASTGLALVGDLEGSLAAGQAAAVGGERVGDPLSALMGFGSQAFVWRFRGDYAAALKSIWEAVDRADQTPNRVAHRFQIMQFYALSLSDFDRFPEARAAIERGRRLAEGLGTAWNLPLYDLTMAYCNMLSGDWDDVEREVADQRSRAEESGTRHGLLLAQSMVAIIRVHRGDLAGAAEAVGNAEREFAETGPQWGVHWMRWARAAYLEAQGDVAGAFGTLDSAWRASAAGGQRSECIELGPELVRTAVAAGESARAGKIAAEMQEFVRADELAPAIRGARLLCRAMASADVEAAREAVATYQSGGRALELAVAREIAADLVAPQLGAERGQLLLDAMTGYLSLRANRDLDRVSAKLRRLGIRRPTGVRRERPTSGWDSLTESELRVARLVATGRSNPQIAEELFLSRHTVHTHMSHILGKLGISSRVELAARAALRG
jgi:DNA-binding CsgD family transcriptional regulator